MATRTRSAPVKVYRTPRRSIWGGVLGLGGALFIGLFVALAASSAQVTIVRQCGALLVGVVGASCLWLASLRLRKRLILSPEGIAYHGFTRPFRTSWANIDRADYLYAPAGLGRPASVREVLILRQPVTEGADRWYPSLFKAGTVVFVVGLGAAFACQTVWLVASGPIALIVMAHAFLSRTSGYTVIPLDDFEPRSASHGDLRAALQAYAPQTYREAGPPSPEVARETRATVMAVMSRGNARPAAPAARPDDSVD